MKEIKYVLLLISHPTYKPTNTEAIDFVKGKLPELHGSDAQIASYHITRAIRPLTTQTIAIDLFGEEVANDSLFTYRTISFAIIGGEGRIFVIYQNRRSGKMLKFLNAMLGRN